MAMLTAPPAFPFIVSSAPLVGVPCACAKLPPTLHKKQTTVKYTFRRIFNSTAFIGVSLRRAEEPGQNRLDRPANICLHSLEGPGDACLALTGECSRGILTAFGRLVKFQKDSSPVIVVPGPRMPPYSF